MSAAKPIWTSWCSYERQQEHAPRIPCVVLSVTLMASGSHRCPFCGGYVDPVNIGDSYELECSTCAIDIEISRRAFENRYQDPELALSRIREAMKRNKRPRIDLADLR
jgi:hypothetical protein